MTIKRGVGAFDFLKDVGGGSGPDVGFGIGIVTVDIFNNGGNEIEDVAENAAANAVLGQVMKETFD